jgi:hypothetical protein
MNVLILLNGHVHAGEDNDGAADGFEDIEGILQDSDIVEV